MEDVGYILASRRLHLNKTQQEIADAATLNMGNGVVAQAEISHLEDGNVVGVFKNQGYTAIDALLEALDWRGDRAYVRHMLHEFARIV
jgi:transcriptional regulator with XRE-family HTH domain